jgi:protoporphyrinogen oxidase
MNIVIVGAGFTGLSAAYRLLKAGHSVSVFEKDPHPGGLAVGYKEREWDWTIEHHYHHWFTNDDSILGLAKEIDYPVLIKRPKTSAFIDGEIFQLDSPGKILSFPKLSLIDRLRMAAVLGFLRFNPLWKPLERINANKFLIKTMGKRAYSMLWEPQLRNKMGEYADEVSLVWFWSRIKKRTPSLAYPEGGYLAFAHALVEKIQKMGGEVFFNTEIVSLEEEGSVTATIKDASERKKTLAFDQAIVTLPSFLFLRITPQLPEDYKRRLVRLRGLGATNLLLRLNKPFLTDNTYWLSICEKNSPVMVVVEHTNFMDKKHFNNEHLVYIGNYPSPDSEKFQMDKKETFKLYDSLLLRLNPTYKKHLIGYELFKAPFAQPIVPTNYSKIIPPMKTPLQHVFLANIEQVYPWDRGTNYAVELGEKVAALLVSDS